MWLTVLMVVGAFAGGVTLARRFPHDESLSGLAELVCWPLSRLQQQAVREQRPAGPEEAARQQPPSE